MNSTAVVDAGGNVTAFITGVRRQEYAGTARAVMAENPSVEQVAFVCQPKSGADLRIELMGGEFCCNALRSIAYLTGVQTGKENGRLRIECSGTDRVLECGYNIPQQSAYALIGPFPKVGEFSGMPLVRLQGISHLIVSGSVDRGLCGRLPELCERLGESALGVMFTVADSVVPVVYVRDTGSTVFEGSCGSGATAVAAYRYSECAQRNLTLKFPKGELETNVMQNGDIRISGKIKVL